MSDITPIPVQSPTIPEEDTSPLSTEIFSGMTLSKLFEETLGGLNVVQKETMDVVLTLKKVLEERQDDSRTQLDIIMMITPILKEYLHEFGVQSESKVKVATAVASIIKGQQANAFFNQTNISTAPSSDQPNAVLEKLKSVDPLKSSNERSLEPVNTKAVAKDSEAANEESDWQVIHSPDYNGE